MFAGFDRASRRVKPHSRENLRPIIRDLVYQEFVVLLVIWLAVVVPVTCHHGPMSLFEPAPHMQGHLVSGHHEHGHHAADAHVGHTPMPTGHHDHASHPASTTNVHERPAFVATARGSSTDFESRVLTSAAPHWTASPALTEYSPDSNAVHSPATTAVPMILSLFAGVLPTGATLLTLMLLLPFLLFSPIVRPQWALAPPIGPPRTARIAPLGQA